MAPSSSSVTCGAIPCTFQTANQHSYSRRGDHFRKIYRIYTFLAVACVLAYGVRGTKPPLISFYADSAPNKSVSLRGTVIPDSIPDLHGITISERRDLPFSIVTGCPPVRVIPNS